MGSEDFAHFRSICWDRLCGDRLCWDRLCWNWISWGGSAGVCWGLRAESKPVDVIVVRGKVSFNTFLEYVR